MKFLSTVILVGQANAQLNVRFTTERVSLDIVADKSLDGHWQVLEATLEEDFQKTWARLIVKSSGPTDTPTARFYAEYFDRDGRFCFSAGFIESFDEQHEPAAFLLGRTRTLAVSFPGLAPAAEPVRVHVYSIDSGSHEIAIRSPPTVLSFTPKAMEILPSNFVPTGDGEPVRTLALAEVTVDVTGRAESVRVLNVSNPEAQEWFTRFVGKLRFHPQLRAEERERAISLVLIRIVLGYKKSETVLPYAARGDVSVKQYLNSLGRRELPAVNEVRFEPESYWSATPTSSSVSRWMYVSLGTDWCPESFRWVSDPDTGVSRREWNLGPSRPRLLIQPQ